MTLELSPADPHAREPLVAALAECGLDPAEGIPRRTAWSDAALVEGVARDPRDDDGYALSPRNTRGATRA